MWVIKKRLTGSINVYVLQTTLSTLKNKAWGLGVTWINPPQPKEKQWMIDRWQKGGSGEETVFQLLSNLIYSDQTAASK